MKIERFFHVALEEVELPDFGEPTVEPKLTSEIYRTRLDAARERASSAGLDFLVIYADREHSANMAYLTGFDPRFEEALLVVSQQSTPVIVVGNEGWGYVGISPLELRPLLFQSFSLLSQSRNESPRSHEFSRARESRVVLASASWDGNISPSGRAVLPTNGSRFRATSPTPSEKWPAIRRG